MAGLISLFVVACLFVHASFALMQESVPEAGSTIAGDEGEENITIICTLLQEAGGPQRITEWFVGTEGEVGDPRVIVDADADYVIVGEPVPNVTDLTYRTNFTILRLTADLDRAVVFCGLGGQNTIFAANFTLRIYRPPTLRDITMQAVQGGVVTTIPLSLDPEAFPFPQQFQWTRNGVAAMNETQTVTYGYPGVTFHAFSRDDSATYNLTATNYRLDNPSVVVGMDMGSLILDVLFPPEIEESSDIQRAVLEGGDITLMCGDSANGNPTPTISWTDNNGATVSDGPEISGSNTLMLTITNTTRNLAGNWTCTVENSVDSIENQIMVVVVVPPSPPTDISIQSQDIGPTYVRVCWQAPLFLGNPNISRYEVTATPVGGGVPVTAGTADNSRDLNVTRLAPGTDYELQVVAISEFGDVIGSSGQSEPGFANTTFTVPAPACQGPPTSSGGVITVRWNYIHTGGLDLTRVVITATKALEASQLAVPNRNLTDLSQISLEVTTFTAGIGYIFTVTAYNEMGSGTAVCDVVPHLIGIPQAPATPDVESNTPGVVLLTLRTQVSGTTPPQMFSFVVSIILASSGTTISRTLGANDYVDGEARQFTIDGLMAGAVYLFSAQAQNKFGSSDFSGNSRVEVAASSNIQQFQLVLSGVQECTTWVLRDTSGKLQSVVQALQQGIEDLCQCGFSVQNILNYAFECSETNQNTVTFRGALLGSAQVTTSQLISYIEQWITVDGILAVRGLRLRVDRSCPVEIRLSNDSLCQPTDSSTSAAVIGGVVAAVLAVLVVTVVLCVVVFLAVRRRHKHSDKDNTHSGKEAVKWSEVTKGDNVAITTTEEKTREYDTVDFEPVSTKQCSAYGILPEKDIEYEALDSEHTSTKQCSAYGIVPETDADNIYEN